MTKSLIDTPCLDRAYAHVLKAHVDAIRDASNDPQGLRIAVQAMLNAFEGVERADPVTSAVASLCKGSETPWPKPGEQLWLPVGSTLCELERNRVPVTVQLTFQGRDGDVLCLVERQCDEGRHTYRVVGLLALAPAKDAPTFFRQSMRTDREFATRFLQEAGILNDKGELAAEYGGAN